MELLVWFGVIFLLSQINAEPCATPDSKEGECIPIDECASIQTKLQFFNITTEDIKFIRRSGCPGEVAKVCCQTSDTFLEYKFPEKPAKRIPLDYRGDEDDDDSVFPTLCGEQDNDDRIIGPVANLNDYPWMALLKYQTEDGKGYACGGALISKRYVITAAHCIVHRILGKPIEVTLGEYDVNTARDCVYDYDDEGVCADPCQYIPVESVLVHPDYRIDNPAKKHDIALIRLMQPANESLYVQPICVPDAKIANKLIETKKKMQVAGWGMTKENKPSNIKRKALVPVVDRQICSRNRAFAIDDSQICAGGGKQDSCSGDSGGPLMQRNVENVNDLRWYVVGIVSFGPKQCAKKDVPSVYTNVAPYYQWIKDNIRT